MMFKLCNKGLSVVSVNDVGPSFSYSIEAKEYKEWLSEGNTPQPEFTDAELAAQATQEKWTTYDEYWAELTVTTDALHKFAASKEALMSVATRRDSMLDTDSILWVESWDSFQTTRIELQEVIVKANTLTQAKITELFGGV